METAFRRDLLLSMLERALAAVDPEPLTRQALQHHDGPATLVAIGKAAPAMCRGAAAAIGDVDGICVSSHHGPVPPGVELLIGDHPVPGESSFRAGRRVIEVVATAGRPIVALISGGGSALCEHPIDGVSPELIRVVTRSLLDSGASIEETNLVRRHMSAIKGGGLRDIASAPIDTYALSDVCGSDPAVIASGPTSGLPADPDAVRAILSSHRITIPEAARLAIDHVADAPKDRGFVKVIADGRTAAAAAGEAGRESGIASGVAPGWVHGDVDTALGDFLKSAPRGITVAAGEAEVEVAGDGIGGRNTHAAVLAAERLSGSTAIFAAFATDGIDGKSHAAGAIVDGETLERGGDPRAALATSDTARYLEQTGDLVVTGPTGTNVSDLWVVWR